VAPEIGETAVAEGEGEGQENQETPAGDGIVAELGEEPPAPTDR